MTRRVTRGRSASRASDEPGNDDDPPPPSFPGGDTVFFLRREALYVVTEAMDESLTVLAERLHWRLEVGSQ